MGSMRYISITLIVIHLYIKCISSYNISKIHDANENPIQRRHTYEHSPKIIFKSEMTNKNVPQLVHSTLKSKIPVTFVKLPDSKHYPLSSMQNSIFNQPQFYHHPYFHQKESSFSDPDFKLLTRGGLKEIVKHPIRFLEEHNKNQQHMERTIGFNKRRMTLKNYFLRKMLGEYYEDEHEGGFFGGDHLKRYGAVGIAGKVIGDLIGIVIREVIEQYGDYIGNYATDYSTNGFEWASDSVKKLFKFN